MSTNGMEQFVIDDPAIMEEGVMWKRFAGLIFRRQGIIGDIFSNKEYNVQIESKGQRKVQKFPPMGQIKHREGGKSLLKLEKSDRFFRGQKHLFYTKTELIH